VFYLEEGPGVYVFEFVLDLGRLSGNCQSRRQNIGPVNVIGGV